MTDFSIFLFLQSAKAADKACLVVLTAFSAAPFVAGCPGAMRTA